MSDVIKAIEWIKNNVTLTEVEEWRQCVERGDRLWIESGFYKAMLNYLKGRSWKIANVRGVSLDESTLEGKAADAFGIVFWELKEKYKKPKNSKKVSFNDSEHFARNFSKRAKRRADKVLDEYFEDLWGLSLSLPDILNCLFHKLAKEMRQENAERKLKEAIYKIFISYFPGTTSLPDREDHKSMVSQIQLKISPKEFYTLLWKVMKEQFPNSSEKEIIDRIFSKVWCAISTPSQPFQVELSPEVRYILNTIEEKLSEVSENLLNQFEEQLSKVEKNHFSPLREQWVKKTPKELPLVQMVSFLDGERKEQLPSGLRKCLVGICCKNDNLFDVHNNRLREKWKIKKDRKNFAQGYERWKGLLLGFKGMIRESASEFSEEDLRKAYALEIEPYDREE